MPQKERGAAINNISGDNRGHGALVELGCSFPSGFSPLTFSGTLHFTAGYHCACRIGAQQLVKAGLPLTEADHVDLVPVATQGLMQNPRPSRTPRSTLSLEHLKGRGTAPPRY